MGNAEKAYTNADTKSEHNAPILTFKARRRDAVNAFANSIGEEQKEQIRRVAVESITEIEYARREIIKERKEHIIGATLLSSVIVGGFYAGIEMIISSFGSAGSGAGAINATRSMMVGALTLVLTAFLSLFLFGLMNSDSIEKNKRRIKAAKEGIRDLSFGRERRNQ